VSGAIRTDFILSAEIMALTLAGLPPSNIYTQAAILACVAVLITFAVYGVVGFIVKIDDMGVALARNAHTGFGKRLGKGLVAGMPVVLKVLSTVGTVAMLWVGGSIIVHGLASIGIHSVEEFIHNIVAHLPTEGSSFAGALEWIATSFLQAVLAILIGIVIVGIVHTVKAIRSKS
jgi:predicted DNA repair protein MutK